MHGGGACMHACKTAVHARRRCRQDGGTCMQDLCRQYGGACMQDGGACIQDSVVGKTAVWARLRCMACMQNSGMGKTAVQARLRCMHARQRCEQRNCTETNYRPYNQNIYIYILYKLDR